MKPCPPSSPGRVMCSSSSPVQRLERYSSVPVVGSDRAPQHLPPQVCDLGSSSDGQLLGENQKKDISPVAPSLSAALNRAMTTLSHHAAHPACPHSAQGLWAAPTFQEHSGYKLRPQNTVGSRKGSAVLR